MFRDAIKPVVTFRLRPTQDLRHPRDAFRFRRKMEQRKAPAKELLPLNTGPLEPEIVPATEVPRDLLDDEEQLRQQWWAQQNDDDEFIAECSAYEER